jgi:ADP-glucose pyrophosphorylase
MYQENDVLYIGSTQYVVLVVLNIDVKKTPALYNESGLRQTLALAKVDSQEKQRYTVNVDKQGALVGFKKI